MSENRITAAEIRGLILFAAAVYIAITFLGAITRILLVFSIIVLLTLILNPVVTWLERYRIPRSLSAFVLSLLGLGLFAGLAWLIVPRIVEEFRQLILDIPSYFTLLRGWLEREAPALAERIPPVGVSLVQRNLERLIPLLGGLTGYAANVAELLVMSFVILISTIYALANPRPLVQGFLALFPNDGRDRVVNIVQTISQQMLSWAYGTLIGMVMVFALTWIALAILGVRAAFLIALVAGILEIVPVLGPFIAGAFAALVALGQSPILALWVILVFVGIQQIEGNVIIPLVMSGQLQLHPVSVIFAVLVMGGLFGLIGVFLATPTAAIIKVLVYKLYIEPRTGEKKEEIPGQAEQVVSGSETGGQGPGARDQ